MNCTNKNSNVYRGKLIATQETFCGIAKCHRKILSRELILLIRISYSTLKRLCAFKQQTSMRKSMCSIEIHDL